jgi:hypothetical protein
MERERDERSNKSSFFVLIVSFSSVLPIFSSFFLTLLPLRLPFACTVVSALVVHNSILFLTFPHFSFLGSGGAHVSCRQSLPFSLSLSLFPSFPLSLSVPQAVAKVERATTTPSPFVPPPRRRHDGTGTAASVLHRTTPILRTALYKRFYLLLLFFLFSSANTHYYPQSSLLTVFFCQRIYLLH